MKKYQKVGIVLSLVTCSLLADPSIKVDPAIENFVPQNRIVLKAKVEDKSGVDVVRAYFKAGDVSTFAFVPMSCKKEICLATLPAPSKDTKTLDYAILVKNGENKVFKSQTFTATATKKGDKLPEYQSADKTNTLHVKTELANAPKAITGFSDNLTVDVVESAAKFGVVAGMYSASQAGTTIAGASAASGATAAGTVVATTAGISTMAVVGGVVAVAGGAAAAGGGGGGGSSSSSSTTPTTPSTPSTPTTPTCSNITGVWSGTASTCYYLTVKIAQIGCSVSGTENCDGEAHGVSGTVNGNTITFGTLSGVFVNYNGTINSSSNHMSGSYSGQYSGSWSLSK